MSEDESYESKSLKKELTSIHRKPNNIEIDAVKTIEEYDKAYSEKKVQATSKNDYPRTGNVGYRGVQRLLQYDSIVQPDKGIKKKIDSFVVQPINQDGKKKFCVYYNGVYVGYDAWDNEIYCSFSSGYHFKPKLQFVARDSAHPFDSASGERVGSYKAVGNIIVHDIYVSEEPRQRKKDIDKLIKDKNLDITNTTFSYRRPNQENNHSSVHSQISYENLVSLTFDQLNDLSTKTYYKDSSGTLKDKDGYVMKWSHDKLEAIK
jgi:acetyltransferase-like isoleucine patch superfamily enzyme